MNKTEFGAYQAVQKCMRVKNGERVVIIADRETDDSARHIYRAARVVTPNVSYFVMEDFGSRPLHMPEEIINKVRSADVSFYCANNEDGELPIFRKPIYDWVLQSKLRHAIMISLSNELLEQGMNADYDELKIFTKKVSDYVENSRRIEVKTELGTDLLITVGDYKWIKCDGDIRPGSYSNLPDGEVYTSPINVQGRAVIDGVLGDHFDQKYKCISKTPVTIDVRDCCAVEGSISCANNAIEADLVEYLFRKGIQNSSRVGEFALGTNLALEKIIGVMGQDEKFPGVHIAFGDSLGEFTGCPITSTQHMDAVITRPTVVVDGKKIMEDGKYLI